MENELNPGMEQELPLPAGEPEPVLPEIPELSQEPAAAPVEELLPDPVPVEALVREPVAPVSEAPAVSFADQFFAEDFAATAILPDEQAIAAAGLTSPEDMELEKIIQEAKADDWDTADLGITQIVAEIKAEALVQEAQLQMPASSEPETGAEQALPEVPVPFRDEEYRDAFGQGESLEQVFGEVQPQAIPEQMQQLPAPEPTPALQEPQPEEKKSLRKIRPKMKKGYGFFGLPHLATTAVWLFIVLLIGVSLGRMMWLCAADVLAFGREDKAVTITIVDTDNMRTITAKLKNAGLIEYPELFKLYAQLTKAEEKISAGTFTVYARYDYHALVNALTPYSPDREIVEVVVPEGYNCAQIFALLEARGVCDADALADYAANGELQEYWFLEGLERGSANCLEGFLFPDTYQFYTNDSPSRVIHKFLDDFDYRFTDKMIEDMATLNERFAKMMANHGYDQAFIDAHQLTVHDVVIVASMIEKETSSNSEGYTISSVIYNRLAYPSKYPYLNIDATLVYALGKRDLTEEDLALDIPYNTYTQEGLPPGAISNPGIASLYAALDPDDSSWYFYALDPDTGSHKFFRYYDDFVWFQQSIKD